jgi:pimeloyl-ACP methyl ester carboxylesterase
VAEHDGEQLVDAGDGRVLSVSVSGAGWPVFLMHGTPGSRTGPRPRASILHRRGVKLISYDRPGYGGSSRHHGRTVANAADDVTAIADELKIERFSVVGRSGGGPHALACAALLPDRVHRAATLVSLAPNVPEFNWFSGMSEENRKEFSAATNGEAAISAQLSWKARRTARDPRSLLESLWAQMSAVDRLALNDVGVQELLVDAYQEAVRSGPYGWIDDVIALRRDWGFSLEKIDVPLRIWHGLEDTFAPAAHARWLASQIPGATLQLQSGTAHFGAVEVLPSMLTWLASTEESEVLGVDHTRQEELLIKR